MRSAMTVQIIVRHDEPIVHPAHVEERLVQHLLGTVVRTCGHALELQESEIVGLTKIEELENFDPS